jgi:hypothetical protein
MSGVDAAGAEPGPGPDSRPDPIGDALRAGNARYARSDLTLSNEDG